MRVTHPRIALEIVDRRSLGVESGSLKNSGQESCTPVLGVALRHSASQGVVHDYECRQVFAFGSEAVGGPRAETGETHATHPGVHLEERRRMVVGRRETGVNKGHVVDMPGELWKDFGSPGAGTPELSEGEGRLHQRPNLLGEKARVFVESLEFFAVPFCQCGFVIPCIHLALATVHEQPDDRFGFCGKVRRMGCQRICAEGGVRDCGGPRRGLAEEGSQGKCPKARAGSLQEIAPIESSPEWLGVAGALSFRWHGSKSGRLLGRVSG